MSRGFDLFTQIIKLNYKGSDRFATKAGCFFTICVVLITLIQSILTFKSIFGFHSPQVTIDRQIVKDPNPTTLNSSEFVFAVKFPDMDSPLSYMSLQMYHYKSIQHDNGTNEEIWMPFPYKKCSSDYMRDHQESFKVLGLSEAFCPDSTVNFRLAGEYHGAETDQVVISITSCSNETSKDTGIVCKPKDEIDSYFNNSKYSILEFYYSDTIFSPTNYSTPATHYLTFAYVYLSPGVHSVKTEVFVNQQDILTDDHLLLEHWNPKNQTTYQIDPRETMIQPTGMIMNDDGTYDIAEIWIQKSRYQYTTKRLYPKLQQGLANIASVFSLCVVIFGLITACYVTRAYLLNIANQIYEFDFQNGQGGTMQRQNKLRKRRSNERMKTPAGGELPASKKKQKLRCIGGVGGIKEPETRPALKLASEKQTISYNFGDFLLSLLPCVRRKKDVLIDNAVDEAERDIDLVGIVKKLQEFERLKNILFDEDELLLLSYSRTPVISLQDSSLKERDFQGSQAIFNETEEKNSNIKKTKQPKSKQAAKEKTHSAKHLTQDSKKSLEDNANNRKTFVATYKSYNSLLKKARYSPISQKILKVMDPKISDIFFDLSMKSAPSPEIMDQNGIGVNEIAAAKRQACQKISKVEAGLIISKHLESIYQRRRTRLSNQKSWVPPNEVSHHHHQQSDIEILGDFVMPTEEQPIQPDDDGQKIPESINNENNQELEIITNTDYLDKMNSSNNGIANDQNNPYINVKIDPEVSEPPPLKQEQSKYSLPSIRLLARTSTGNFSAFGNSINQFSEQSPCSRNFFPHSPS